MTRARLDVPTSEPYPQVPAPSRSARLEPSEKEFYLQHFRHRSILLHVSEEDALATIQPVIDELVANKTLVVVTAAHFAARARVFRVAPQELDETSSVLVDVSMALLQKGCVRVTAAVSMSRARALTFASRLARRLKIHKLVVVDARGGLRRGGRVRSFVKIGALARATRARASHDGQAGSGWTPEEVNELCETVRDGVDSVNLTTAEQLMAELFSYEGSGTLLTAGDYATVEPIKIDDFAEAAALLERGEREGFLLRRTRAERARLLLHGYGVWFEGRRLAGFAALETAAYRRQKVAEIAGLYTITRFHGNGVGVRVVDALAEAARRRGCRALFACTSNGRAAEFFERNGFRRVEAAAVPASKWKGRGKTRPAVFWRDL